MIGNGHEETGHSMTNEIIPVSAKLPRSLADEIEAYLRIAASGNAYVPTRPDLAEKAVSWANNLRQTMPRTKDRAAVATRWLNEFFEVIRPHKGETLASVIRAILMVCAEMPAEIWNRQTQAEAFKKIKYFPTPSVMFEFLEPFALRAERTLRVLDVIASAVPVDPDPDRGPAVPPGVALGHLALVKDHVQAVPNSGTKSGLPIRVPIRSVEEQLAILRGDKPMPHVTLVGLGDDAA
jgi:hypothetical protein